MKNLQEKKYVIIIPTKSQNTVRRKDENKCFQQWIRTFSYRAGNDETEPMEFFS
jgi:hypothetical protein